MRNLTRYEPRPYKTLSKIILLQLGIIFAFSNGNNDLKLKVNKNHRNFLSEDINTNEIDSSVDIAKLYDVDDIEVSKGLNEFYKDSDELD